MKKKRKTFSKSFYLMILGQIISVLGASLLRFALSLYILDLTGSEVIFATLLAISNIPLLLSPLGGAIADRFNRRNLMVIFDFLSGGIVLIFHFTLFALPESIPLIAVTIVLLSVISALDNPTGASAIPSMVKADELEGANGILQAVEALSFAVAPFIGGILYGVIGIGNLVIVCATAFFSAAVMEIFIKITFIKREQTEHIVPTIVKDMKEGISFAFKQPFVLKSMITAALLNLLLTPYFIVGAPIILRITMNSGEAVYGVGMGLINFATIIGALMIGVFAKKLRMATAYRLIFVIAILILPMALSVTPFLLDTGFYPSYILFVFCAIPIAAILTILSIFVITAVQKKTPNENLGKVMAIITAVAQCAAPAGQVMYGVFFGVFSNAVFIPTLFVSAAMFVMMVLTKKIFKNEVVEGQNV